eukprot:jgi/Hompol1/6793/HPOL_005092-RA
MYSQPGFRLLVEATASFDEDELALLQQSQTGSSVTIVRRGTTPFACVIPAIAPSAAPPSTQGEQPAIEPSSAHSSSDGSDGSDGSKLVQVAAAQTIVKKLGYTELTWKLVASFNPWINRSQLTGGYWTYELCQGRHVRQFHLPAEKDNRPLKPGAAPTTYLLGRASPPASASDHSDATIKQDTSELGAAAYLEEIWRGGTDCDVTGLPRETTVQYFCSATLDSHIASLRETSSCKYLVVVMTPLLCKDPAFVRHAVDSAPAIECRLFKPSSRHPQGIEANFQRTIPSPVSAEDQMWLQLRSASGESLRSFIEQEERQQSANNQPAQQPAMQPEKHTSDDTKAAASPKEQAFKVDLGKSNLLVEIFGDQENAQLPQKREDLERILRAVAGNLALEEADVNEALRQLLQQ